VSYPPKLFRKLKDEVLTLGSKMKKKTKQNKTKQNRNKKRRKRRRGKRMKERTKLIKHKNGFESMIVNSQ